MPAVLEQINGMTVSEKMRIMEYLLKSIAQAVEEANARRPSQEGDFSRFAGRWSADEAKAFSEATARTVDEEDWK